MGVEARLVLHAEDQYDADRAAQRAFERLEELERAWSDWDPRSELSRLEVKAGRGAVALSDDLYDALDRSLELARATDGAFDPTGAPVFDLWREAREAGAPPEGVRISEALAVTGHERVALDAAARTAVLAPGTELDLGGIAKGLAADLVLEQLAARGVESAAVDIGGDLALGAPPPGELGWIVLCGSGAPGSDPVRRTLSHCGVATSGDTEQFLETPDGRYSHLVDPRTGLAASHGLTFTVVAADGATADALASAASCLPLDEARALVGRFEGAELLVEDPSAADDVPASAPAAQQELGWVDLFDGESLAGWTATGGRYDGDAVWTVEDGAITGRTNAEGEGGLLYTERSYTCFELELETRLDHPFDSGIFFRMRPPESGLKGAQVTLDHREGGEIAAIYADGFLEHNEQAAEHFVRDEWNHVRVRVTGFDFRVQVWVNGERVTDYALPAGEPGFAPSGLVGLQVHGADPALSDNGARFRRVRIRELPVFADREVSGWRDLLADGLEGLELHGTSEGYTVEDGELVVPTTGSGHAATRDDFRDFRLRLDFKLARLANSGLFLRGDRAGGDPAYSGCEVQILDDFEWEEATGSTLQPYQKTGGLYGAVAPGPDKELNPPGEWNTYEVLYRGSRLAVALNGRALYDVDTLALEAEPPFADRVSEGFVGFQQHSAPEATEAWSVRFRDVRIQPLEDTPGG